MTLPSSDSRRGGAREGAGRPKKSDALRARVQVHLSDEAADFVHAMGGSAWLRSLVERERRAAREVPAAAPDALARAVPILPARLSAPDAPAERASVAALTGVREDALALFRDGAAWWLLDTQASAAKGMTVVVRVGTERLVRRITALTTETVTLAPECGAGRRFDKSSLWIEGVVLARLTPLRAARPQFVTMVP